jgi:hypothetical protein
MEDFLVLFHKRLKKDLLGLPQYNIIYIQQDIVEIHCKTPLERKIIFRIRQQYPFQKPIVKYDNILLIEKTYDNIYSDLYTRKFKMCCCACCVYPYLMNHWSPCITLEKIYKCIIEEEKKWNLLFNDIISDNIGYFSDDIQKLISEFLI